MGLFQDILGYINAGRAGNAIANSNIAAEHGVIDATGAGQAAIQNAVGTGQTMLGQAGAIAPQIVAGGANQANTTLANAINSAVGNASPYMQAGNQGITQLEQYAQSPASKFSFNLNDWLNSPGMQWQMQQGTNAIQNQAAAQGLGAGGNVLKDLTKYGQGLASTYYNDAFNRALSTFNTNQSATMQNLGALIGAGQFGTGQANSAIQNLTQPMAANKMTTGLFGGNTAMTTADLMAKLGYGGAQDVANLGLKGAQLAGDFATGAGTARAGGIMGQGNAMGQGIADLGSLATLFL